MSVKVKIITDPKFIKNEMSEIEKLSNKHTKMLADKTWEEMIWVIENTRQRDEATDNLSNNITVEKIPNGYGVGNIQQLNKNAPYWAWINFGVAGTGRTIPPGTDENPHIKGHFGTDTTMMRGRFIKGKPKFPMNPKNPIKAKNYIEIAYNKVLSMINEILPLGNK